MGRGGLGVKTKSFVSLREPTCQKIKKKRVIEKVVKSKKTKKYAKNGRFFYHRRLIFEKFKKRPRASLTFDPKKLYTKFHQNPLTRFAVIIRTDGRTDRTDHIGPPEKFSGDQLTIR